MDLFSADLLSNKVKELENPSSLINGSLVNLFDETIENFLLSELFHGKNNSMLIFSKSSYSQRIYFMLLSCWKTLEHNN
jgi:hypothetical protein